MEDPLQILTAENTKSTSFDAAIGLCPGALIMTANGERTIESLAVGDQVLTLSGSLRSIRQISQTRSPRAGTFPEHQLIRIKAGALSARCPRRDLLVAPSQALVIDGLLVSANLLVNEISVVREPARETAYIQIDLDADDAIWADGAAIEAFAATPYSAEPDESQRVDRASSASSNTLSTSVVRALKRTTEPDSIRKRLAARASFYAPVPESALSGAVEFVGADEVRGWARNELHREMPVCLDVLVDGQLVMQVLANQYRPDLKQTEQSLGFHGFTAKLPKGVRGTITVRRSSDRQPLPRTLQNHAA